MATMMPLSTPEYADKVLQPTTICTAPAHPPPLCQGMAMTTATMTSLLGGRELRPPSREGRGRKDHGAVPVRDSCPHLDHGGAKCSEPGPAQGQGNLGHFHGSAPRVDGGAWGNPTGLSRLDGGAYGSKTAVGIRGGRQGRLSDSRGWTWPSELDRVTNPRPRVYLGAGLGAGNTAAVRGRQAGHGCRSSAAKLGGGWWNSGVLDNRWKCRAGRGTRACRKRRLDGLIAGDTCWKRWLVPEPEDGGVDKAKWAARRVVLLPGEPATSAGIAGCRGRCLVAREKEARRRKGGASSEIRKTKWVSWPDAVVVANQCCIQTRQLLLLDLDSHRARDKRRKPSRCRGGGC